MKMTTNIRRLGFVTIVDIRGRIVFGQEIESLRASVRELLSEGHKRVLFNLSNVDYIDTSGIGYLVSALTSVRNRGGELKLVNPNKKAQELIEATKLDRILEVMNDEAAAVSSFGESAAATA